MEQPPLSLETVVLGKRSRSPTSASVGAPPRPTPSADPAAAAVASARTPTEAWRDAVSTFWNTVDTIGVAVEFLPSRLLLELRSVDSRWNLAVCGSVKRLKCKTVKCRTSRGRSEQDATLGGLVDSFREVRALTLRGCKISVEGFSHLLRLGGLTELDVSDTDIDAAGLDFVVRLPRVTSLSCQCHCLTDANIGKICVMTQLTSLDLRHCSDLTSASLAQLSAALPKLASLSIEGTLTSPAALQHLRHFPLLTSLTVQGVVDATADHLCCLTALTALDVSDSTSEDFSDVGLASLCGSLPRLTSLSLRRCWRLTADGMESVSHLTALTSLDVGVCGEIDKAGVAAISRLSGLKTLCMECVLSVSDASLVHVAKLVGLTKLNISGCRYVSDVGVQRLAPLTALQTLDLTENNVGDACTATLSSFKELRTLKLGCSKITDDGLRRIAQLTRLTELDLRHYHVTNAGVVALSQLRSLERLNVGGGSRVSDTADASLRAAIPGLQVLR